MEGYLQHGCLRGSSGKAPSHLGGHQRDVKGSRFMGRVVCQK